MQSLIDYYINKVGAVSLSELTLSEMNVLMVCQEFIIDHLKKEIEVKQILKEEISETN